MSARNEQKSPEQNIPGMNRRERFGEVQHAENAGAALKRIFLYFAQEKAMVFSMLIVVVFGTFCGVYAPSLQSSAIDMIAGTRPGNLLQTVLFMLAIYLLYSGSQLLQNLFSAKLSQRIVKRMRSELFGKLVDLPVRYLDTHSHGDVMSRMTNDIENISTTVSQSLPSLFSGVLTIIGTMAIMLWYCWQLRDGYFYAAGHESAFGEGPQVFAETPNALRAAERHGGGNGFRLSHSSRL